MILLASCRQEDGGDSAAPANTAMAAPSAIRQERSRDSGPADAPGREAEFFEAVRLGDTATVRLLLRQGADPDSHPPGGVSALALAAEAGHEGVVKLLTDGATESLNDALYLAACRDHAGLVDFLVRRGASVHARTLAGRTALMSAALAGAESAVEVLLEHGANRYALDSNGFTAGQYAMMAGHLELGRQLLVRPEPDEFLLGLPDELETTARARDRAAGPGALISPTLASPISDAAARRAGPAVLQEVALEAENPERALPEEGVEELPTKDGLVMREFRERWFPFMITEVDGSRVGLRFLFGPNQRITVRKGDTIPGTRLKIVWDRKPAAEGDPEAVELEDPRSGLRRRIPVGREAPASDRYAVLEAKESRMIARPGEMVQIGAGERYRVIDVHPSKVVIESARTGQLAVVPMHNR